MTGQNGMRWDSRKDSGKWNTGLKDKNTARRQIFNLIGENPEKMSKFKKFNIKKDHFMYDYIKIDFIYNNIIKDHFMYDNIKVDHYFKY